MATPAAAALFARALPQKPSEGGREPSGSSSRGGAARGISRGASRGGRAGRGGFRSGADDDVGMYDAGGEGAGASRRGRTGTRAGPMGERVSIPHSSRTLAHSLASADTHTTIISLADALSPTTGTGRAAEAAGATAPPSSGINPAHPRRPQPAPRRGHPRPRPSTRCACFSCRATRPRPRCSTWRTSPRIPYSRRPS